mmetsp:Transcript_52429/g.104046  ORF Transcript_52429/g.104046 Transcript_52429/m.104046 type:complete len:234 (-) Transcript_52429:523-1224(-)
MLCCVHFLEEILVHPHLCSHSTLAKLVQQGPCHHGRWRIIPVETELVALWVIISTMVRENRIANPCQMWGLCQIISSPTGPHKHIVSKVANGIPSLLFWTREHPPKSCNMLMIPSVPIRNGCTPANARNLIAIIPPCHYTRVLWRVRINPFVSLQVIINEHRLAVSALHHVRDLRVGQRPCHPVTMLDEHRCPWHNARNLPAVKDNSQREYSACHDRLRIVVVGNACLVVGLI